MNSYSVNGALSLANTGAARIWIPHNFNARLISENVPKAQFWNLLGTISKGNWFCSMGSRGTRDGSCKGS